MPARALLLVWLLTSPAFGAELVAERMTPENAARLQVGGPDADGGVGDWALRNGTLCAVIADAAHEAPISPQGGGLLDLVRCGRANDQWSALVPLVNLSRGDVVPIERIETAVEAGTARVIARGGRPGLAIRTTYALDLERPDELGVVTELTRGTGGDRMFAFGEVVFHAVGQLRPFALLRRDLEGSVGFAHPSGDPDSPLSMLGGIVASDAHVLVGGEEIAPGLAYGIALTGAERVRPDGRTDPVGTFSITGESFTMTGVFAEPFWVGGGGAPGFVEMAQLLVMDLDPGETLRIERRIRVGERADVASLTDGWFEDAPRVTGRVDRDDARIHVTTARGAPVTQLRPEPDGAFTVRLPAGRYGLRAVTPDGRSSERSFAVDGTPLALDPLVLGAPAVLRLPEGRTVHLVFVGEDGTPDPVFGDDLLGFRVNGEPIPAAGASNRVSLAGHAEDLREVRLAPGRYRVFATRGPEYTLEETTVTLAAGEVKTLEIDVPERALETPGWIGADLHVHSAESFDTAFPLGRQLSAFAANGAEVLVATEHDRIFDPRPELARLGLGDRMVALTGVEVTSAFTGGDTPHTIGHLNAYPVERDPLAYRGGAPRGEGRRLRSVLGDLGRGEGAPFVQLNHPRGVLAHSGGQGAFLSHLSVVGEPFEPTRPLDAAPNRVLVERDPATGLRDLDFDGIELLNGANLDRFRLIRADWLSLLLQGEVRVAVGNSDTHRAGEQAALPRTYVALADDSIAGFDEAAFWAAFRAGHAFATTGPLLDVRMGPARPGDRFQGNAGELVATVAAAPWVPVERVRVHRDGEIVADQPIERGGTLTLPLRFERDAFVVVEAEGRPAGAYAAVLPGFTPLAIANPIFVDADGDGAWTAPGLPDPAPPLLADPLRSGLLEESP